MNLFFAFSSSMSCLLEYLLHIAHTSFKELKGKILSSIKWPCGLLSHQKSSPHHRLTPENCSQVAAYLIPLYSCKYE